MYNERDITYIYSLLSIHRCSSSCSLRKVARSMTECHSVSDETFLKGQTKYLEALILFPDHPSSDRMMLQTYDSPLHTMLSLFSTFPKNMSMLAVYANEMPKRTTSEVYMITSDWSRVKPRQAGHLRSASREFDG